MSDKFEPIRLLEGIQLHLRNDWAKQASIPASDPEAIATSQALNDVRSLMDNAYETAPLDGGPIQDVIDELSNANRGLERRLRDSIVQPLSEEEIQLMSDILTSSIERLSESVQPNGDRKPIAWYVRRNAPGMRDDGRRLGPFWRESDADDMVDDIHSKHPLYN